MQVFKQGVPLIYFLPDAMLHPKFSEKCMYEILNRTPYPKSLPGDSRGALSLRSPQGMGSLLQGDAVPSKAPPSVSPSSAHAET